MQAPGIGDEGRGLTGYPGEGSPGWDYLPDLVKQRAFTVALEKTHKAAELAALSDEQRQKEIQRIFGVVG